jgi:probable HAF family extracellular repeat protein
MVQWSRRRGPLHFAARINNRGQIVGAYSTDTHVPVFKLPHGFLLDDGVFTKIDVPGAVETRPFGINNLGQIVGEYVDAARRLRGFLFTDGVYTTIDAPFGTSTSATDIDDSGHIVGSSFGGTTAAGPTRGFLRDAQGVFTPIDAPGAPPPPGRPQLPTTQVYGLNNHGQITGFVTDSEFGYAFVLDNGVFTTIDAPDAVGGTFALDINDEGRLVGAFDVVAHGFLQDRRGNVTTIDHPDAIAETVLSGINRRGQIVGAILDATDTFRSFLYDKGRFITIEVPGALGSGANKINDGGQVVGAYSTLTSLNHAFPARGYLWDQGVVTNIDFPGARHTNPADIDNHGQIVGTYQDAAGVSHGFLRDVEGNYTTIAVPGAASTTIGATNDRGQMVGEYRGTDGKLHGFLLDDGIVTTIDAPGATQGTSPTGINNHGQIVGSYFNDTQVHGFLLSDGRFTTTRAPGAIQDVLPFDIDDRGRIVGTYF